MPPPGPISSEPQSSWVSSPPARFSENNDGVRRLAVRPGARRGRRWDPPYLVTAEEAVFRLSRRAVAEHANLYDFIVVAGQATLAPGPWWGPA